MAKAISSPYMHKATEGLWLSGVLLFGLSGLLVFVAPWAFYEVYRLQDFVGSLDSLPTSFRATSTISSFYRDHFAMLTPLIGFGWWLEWRVRGLLAKGQRPQMARRWNVAMIIGLAVMTGIAAHGVAVPGVVILDTGWQDIASQPAR